MELRHLRYFVAVAEELHFGRAAKKLFISQPPLSLQIQHLEKELRVILLNRTKRQVSLTPEGKAFYSRAKLIVSSAELAMEEVQRISRGEKDRISLGYMSAVMLAEFSPLLRSFHEQNPGVELDLAQMPSDQQYDALVDGQIDGAFVDLSVGEMSDHFRRHHLDGRRVLHERLHVAIPKGHHLAKRRKLSLSELSNQQFIVFPRRSFPSFYDTVISMCRNAGFSPVIRIEAERMPDMLSYTAANMGISIAPDCAKHSWSRAVDFVRLDEEAYVDIWLISRVDSSPAVCRFRDMAERWTTTRGIEPMTLREN